MHAPSDVFLRRVAGSPSDVLPLPCRKDTFIRGADPAMCLPGVLARYMQLRHRILPVPLHPHNTLAEFEEWARQPLFQTQISHHARARRPGCPTTPFQQSKSETTRTAKHIAQLYSMVGIQRTEGFVTRRLRQGGGNAALQLGLPGDLVAKRMGHNAGDVHVRNYTAMNTDPAPAMAAMAGHTGRHIRLGRTALTAREGVFRPLYDAVSCLPRRAGERLDALLASGHRLENSYRQM